MTYLAAVTLDCNPPRGVNSPITVAAMIDTGASSSVIQAGIAAMLGIQPIGVQSICTPTSQNVMCGRYAVGFLFPATAGVLVPVMFDMVMTETPLQGQNIQCLLGRDFLSHGILVYSGPDNSFTFSL